MGKRLKQQRRGKGSPMFIARHGIADVEYLPITPEQKENALKGKVVDLVSDRVRSAVLADILFENGLHSYMIAPEGMHVGQELQYGKKAALEIGNVLPLNEIAEGCPIFNIEKRPGDGGCYIKTSGIYGYIVTKEPGRVYVKLPSGKTVEISPEARATIGNVSAGGRTEKPMIKAGTHYHAMHAKGYHYPGVRGVAMNPVDHPFGGAQHHAGKSKSVSRHAAPGQKVGAIASKRTGRTKR